MKQKNTKIQDSETSTEKSVFDDTNTFTPEEEVTQDPVTEQEPSLPMSLVRKLMGELEEKLTKKFASNSANVKRTSDVMSDDLDYVNSLEDDWLDVPVVFFAYSFNFAIHGDKKRGVETVPPHGAIRFKPLIRTKKKGLRGTQVVSVSSVKINSRAEAEYARNHSQFGIAFYENMESALNADSTWAQKMVEAQQSISRLSDMQIIARAKQEGISITQSPESMRRQLIELVAKKAIAREDELLYGKMRTAVQTKEGRSLVEMKK